MLRSLVWKEWREQRPIVLAGILVAVVLPMFILAATLLGSTHDRVVATVQMLPLFYAAVLWPLFAVAAGATTIANDASGSQLAFLLSRPAPRWLIWVTKVGAGLFALAVVVFLSELVARGLAALIGAQIISFLVPNPEWARANGAEASWPLLVPGFPLVCFAWATFFSSAMRRQLMAAILAGIVAFVLCANTVALWWLLDFLPTMPATTLMAACSLFIGSGLAASLTVFSRGELLLGARARSVAIASAVAALSISAALVGAGALHAARAPGPDAVFGEVSVAAGGRKVAVTVGRPDSGASRRIWVMDFDSGVTLTATRRLTHRPALSADGEWLAYLSVRGPLGLRAERAQLRVMRTDGTEDRPLATGLPLSTGSPAFAPDGRRVLITTSGGLHIADMAGGPARIVPLSSPAGQSCELAAWDRGRDQLVLLCTVQRAPGEVRWIDPDSGEIVGRFELPSMVSQVRRWGLYRSAVTLPAADRLTLRLREKDDRISFWTLDLGRRILAPLQPAAEVLARAFTSDASRLADAVAVDGDLEIRIRELPGGEPRILGAVPGQGPWMLGTVPGQGVRLRFVPGDRWLLAAAVRAGGDGQQLMETYAFATDGTGGHLLGRAANWLQFEFHSDWASGDRLVMQSRRVARGEIPAVMGLWFREIRLHDLRTGEATLLPATRKRGAGDGPPFR